MREMATFSRGRDRENREVSIFYFNGACKHEGWILTQLTGAGW